MTFNNLGSWALKGLGHQTCHRMSSTGRQRCICSQSIGAIERWVSECVVFRSHSTHRATWRRIFPGNQLHWHYWQPKTRKQNTTYTLNTKEKQKKTTLANKTNYTLLWYTFHDLQPLNRASPILPAPEPTQGWRHWGFLRNYGTGYK